MCAIDRAAADAGLGTVHRRERLAVVGDIHDRQIAGAAVFGGNADHQQTVAARCDGVIPTQLRNTGAADGTGTVKDDVSQRRTRSNQQTSEPQESGRETTQGVLYFHGVSFFWILSSIEPMTNWGKTKNQGQHRAAWQAQGAAHSYTPTRWHKRHQKVMLRSPPRLVG